MWLLGASLSLLAPARKRIKRPNPQRLGLGAFLLAMGGRRFFGGLLKLVVRVLSLSILQKISS
jgi:hypothetical protein